MAFRPPWYAGLRLAFAAYFAVSGYGYRAVNADFKWLPDLKVTYVGTATNIVKAKSSGKRDPVYGVYTPDGIFTRLRSDGAVTLTVPAGMTCLLHYLRQPGGGMLAVDRNGVRALTPDTGGDLGDAAVLLPAGTKYKLYSTSAAWVQVNALEIRGGPGFSVSRLGRGQDNPRNYNTGDTASTAGVLSGLAPHLFLIQTDWYTPPQSQATFITDLKAYIAFAHAACPAATFTLVSKHNSINHRADVAECLYQIAQDVTAAGTTCGFIDHYQVKTYEENLALGYLAADGAHLSDAGGAFYGQYDADLMRATR